MTTATLHRNASLLGRISTLIASVKESHHRYGLYRQTLRELNQLSDRELHDIGVHPSMFEQIALQTAYAK